MKKILYFATLSLLLCGSCNYNKQDEEDQYLKIDDSSYIDLQTGDTIEIAWAVDDLSEDSAFYEDSIKPFLR